jgi:hypothetical protein
MATSKEQIANLALANIGAKNTIESFNELSTEAKLVKAWYDASREAVLEAMDWNFARKRLALSQSVTAAPDGVWTYRYDYPSDCIAAREIENPLGPDADAVPFEVELDSDTGVKSVLTDMETAKLIYTKNITSTFLFTPYFVHAMAAFLAFNIAFALTGKRGIVDDMGKKFQFMISMAEGNNMNESVRRPPREASWIRARD